MTLFWGAADSKLNKASAGASADLTSGTLKEITQCQIMKRLDIIIQILLYRMWLNFDNKEIIFFK